MNQKTEKVEKTKKTSILEKARPVQETASHLTCLFYGRSGTGKTTLASTFPKPMLLLDIQDQGTSSIRDVEEVDVLPIAQWEDLEGVYWALYGGKHKYKTVVIDTLSGLQSLALEEYRNKEGLGENDTLSRRAWGDISGSLTRWVYAFRNLSLNVIFLAQDRVRRESEDDTGDDGELDPEVGPAVIPSVARTVCAAVNVIGNTYIKQKVFASKKKPGTWVNKTSYMLRIGPHPYYITKLRSPRSTIIPEALQDPSYITIYNLSIGENNGKATQEE